MSIGEHEQRIRDLEATVAALKLRLPVDGPPIGIANEDVISATDHPLVPAVAPKQSHLIRAKLAVVRDGRRDLGLSRTEWESLDAGEADD